MKKKLLISEASIQVAIKDMAKQINSRYDHLSIVCVLKGAICFTADFIRLLEIPFEIHFIRAQSYGMRGTQSGNLSIEGTRNLNLNSQNVLVIDDIYDTGQTLSGICAALNKQKPSSLSSLVLLRKKVEHTGEITPDYVCFDIEDKFVIGYGLDYKENFRGLKDIYQVDE